ncbi:hypothetical protein DXT87_16065 [Arthrobacter sp. AET 35A]|nr:hypothetical protein [Arthrobacter sp. AET 35A]
MHALGAGSRSSPSQIPLLYPDSKVVAFDIPHTVGSSRFGREQGRRAIPNPPGDLMPRAYKLPNAAAMIVEIEAVQEVLNDL